MVIVNVGLLEVMRIWRAAVYTLFKLVFLTELPGLSPIYPEGTRHCANANLLQR